MCGLAGLLSGAGFTRDELIDHARRMSDPLAHRGPDDSGIWVDERAGVAFGFRRLAVVDLSEQGHQPMTSPSGRFVVVFNGEIYNFADLRRELAAHGHIFRGHSDTEVVVAAFDQWGVEDAVRRLLGMFAIAVWDSEWRELSLIRDRLGKKPLYVYHEPGLLTFGSELKALIAGPSFDRSIDAGAVAAYLRYLCVPAPGCIFRHAIKVRPAHILTCAGPDPQVWRSRPYWSLRHAAARGLADPYTGSDADAVNDLEALLQDAVRRRMHADVPLGSLLSGGIDSSTVLALMTEASGRRVKSYTVGFEEREYNEAPAAANVARHLGTDHTEVIVTSGDAHEQVPRLAEVFDEPFANPSQLPSLLVCGLARKSITVALCGDGGDEIFGGYNRYVYGARLLQGVRRVPRIVRAPVGAAVGAVPSAAWDRLSMMTAMVAPVVLNARVGERMHKLGRVMTATSVDAMYRSLLSACQHPDRVVTAFHPEDEQPDMFDGREPAELLDRMMLCDQLTYLPDDALTKLDRASMAVGLEMRAPLLDHRVVEFSWQLPRAVKVRGNVGKWILRQILYRRVPRSLLERPKMGFSVPVDRWLRGPLREWAEDLLSFDRLEKGGTFTTGAIRQSWKDLLAGRRPAGTELWAVLMFQAWRTRWGV